MVIGHIYRHAALTPDKVALVHNGTPWSYAAFAQAIECARRDLLPLRLRAGGYAVLAMHNLVDAWIYGIALRSVGLTTVPLPASRDLADLRLDAVEGVFASTRLADADFAAQAAPRGWRHFIRTESVPVIGQEVPLHTPAAPQGSHIMMTSGTTGDYKMLLHGAEADASVHELNARMGGTPAIEVTFAGDFPLLTAGGWRWPQYTWAAGGTVVFHQGQNALRTLLGSGITRAFATPATLARLLADPQQDLQRDDGIRLMVTGGPLPKVLWEQAQARITRQVYSWLAASEVATFCLTRIETAEDLRSHRIHPAREVQVVDEAHRPLPAGVTGVVRIRQLSGLSAYLNDPETSRQFFHDGYFYPGDLGVISADGRLTLQGRVTDVINALGTKIATGPIEQTLADRHGVEGVCVFAAPNAAGEDEVHIVLQSTRTLDQAQLKSTAQELLSMFRGVHFHQMAQLPRNHMGKIRRQELRRQILEKK